MAQNHTGGSVAGAAKVKTIIVLPVYNEEKTLDRQLSMLCENADMIIVINDGSTDTCRKIILDRKNDISCINLIDWKENKGKAEALKAAFNLIMERRDEGVIDDNDIVVVTDADGQLPAEAVKPSLEFFSAKKLEVLIGNRDFSLYPLIKKMGNIFLSTLAGILGGFHFNDTQCGFRLLSVSALGKILPFYHASGYSCEQELSIIPVLLGMKVDNSFEIKPAYYRSNSTFPDAFQITFDSFATYFRVKSIRKNHAD